MSLRIALLTHSTNPRGGVVHALELADALAAAGHRPVLHAPDPKGTGFFRPSRARNVAIPARPLPGADVATLVEVRAAETVAHFADPANRRFDVFHAGDGITANALATLAGRGLIPGFLRTVHHVDRFADPRLAALQARSIDRADRVLCVSRHWKDRLFADHGRLADLVGNGVDMERFTPVPAATDAALRAGLGLDGPAPLLLAVGGVEGRKNTVAMLEAFRLVRARIPDARLVIAGGASLLDHAGYQARFSTVLAESGLPAEAVVRLGPVEDAAMPALYRIADALLFASVEEGFGLVVLEALAAGLPVVLSRIPPFTEYATDEAVVWCDPLDPRSIAEAAFRALDPATAARLEVAGRAIARAHPWSAVADRHLPAYEDLAELCHA